MLKQFNEIQEYGLKTQKVFECVTIQYIEISVGWTKSRMILL